MSEASDQLGLVAEVLRLSEALTASQRRERDLEAKLSETYRRADAYVIELEQLQARLAELEAQLAKDKAHE